MNSNFIVMNIRDCFEENKEFFGEQDIRKIISHFSCNKNLDVENFLKNQSIEFTRKNQSVTYLVFDKDKAVLVGYFTLTIKPITIDVMNNKEISNTIKKKIARIGKFDEKEGSYTLSAYLIAQLGKNFSNDINKVITGKELLDIAISTIEDLQYRVGGTFVFLEAENNEKLLSFYKKENGFRYFSTKEVSKNDKDLHFLIRLFKII